MRFCEERVKEIIAPVLAWYEAEGVVITYKDLCGKDRSIPLPQARAWAARALYDHGREFGGIFCERQIGKMLGGKHYSSVSYWLNELAPAGCEVTEEATA